MPFDPVRPFTIDNRSVAPVFLDSSPLSEGAYNFASSLINAPQAAAAVRREKEKEDLARLFEQKKFDRQTALDELALQWHDEESTRNAARDALDVQKFEADKAARQQELGLKGAGMFGTGVKNAAELLGKYFDRSKKTGALTQDQAWRHALGVVQAKAGFDANGKPNPVDMQEVQTIQRAILAGEDIGQQVAEPMPEEPAAPYEPPGWWESIGKYFGGMNAGAPGAAPVIDPAASTISSVGGEDVGGGGELGYPAPVAPAAIPETVADATSFWNLRPSGAAGGPQTLGDVLGGRWFGQGEQVAGQAPDQKLADLPRFQASGQEYAAKLPPEQAERYLGIRNELLSRWAQAVQSGDVELEGRIAKILDEQNRVTGEATGVMP